MKKNYVFISRLLKGKLGKLGLFMACMGSALPSMVTAQGLTYSFTTGGATGPTAPTNTQLNSAYASTNLNGLVTYANGIQSFTVPATAPYRIIAIGAQGGYNGGRGAYISGDYTLTAGTVLKILVGQQGTTADNNTNNGGFGNSSGGGGGASFVSGIANSAYVVAGGGGGNGDGYNGFHNATPCCFNGMEASLTTAGNGYAPSTTGGTPGSNGGSGGNGGTCTGFSNAGAGAGFSGNGSSCQSGIAAQAFVNGGAAGLNGTYAGNILNLSGDGGFGGGAGCYDSGTGERGGGGGGYSGGGGGVANTGYDASGGGGGSFNSGVNQTNSLTANSGDGKVFIVLLCDVNLTASGPSSLTPAICSGNSLTLTTSAVSNYSWSNGSTTSSIVVSPTVTTTYSVTGTSSLGCSNASNITVTVSPGTPTLSVVSTTNSACLGQSVTLTASGALTYTWSNSVVNGVAFLPNATNTYTIIGGNGCGTTSAVTTVTVSMLPINIAASATLLCSGNAATLAATGANSYTWMPGSFYQANYVPSPTATTAYTVTGQTGGCLGTATVNIVTKAVPSVSITAPVTTVCNGGSVTLNALGNALTYTWSNGQTGNSITVSPANTGAYSVVGTNSVNCTSVASQVIIVTPNPTISIYASATEVCPAGSTTLSASGATTFTWASNGTTTSTIEVNPTTTTVYNVSGSYTTGCQSTTMISISVFQPTVSVISSTAICIGSNAILTADQAETYSWSNGSTGPSINVTPTSNTTYTVTGFTTSQYGLVCPDTAVVSVIINPLPVIGVSVTNATICIGHSTSLTATGAVTYTWAGGLGNTAVISVSPVANQTFSVSGKDANGCKGTGAVSVVVSPCTGISTVSEANASLLVYPNPSNGEFTISADQTITLTIVNELGQQVRAISLNSTTPAVTLNNLANGVYFITGVNENGSVKQKIVIAK